jgi:hypothetical protein
MKRIIFVFFSLFLVFPSLSFSGVYKGLEPGVSKKSDADRILGRPIKEIVKGERYGYDPKGTGAHQLNISFNKQTQVIEGIEIFPESPTIKAKYQKWLGLKVPTVTQKHSNGNLVEYYANEGIALLYSGPQDTYPIAIFAHVNPLTFQKKTVEGKPPTELITGKWRWFNGLIVEITGGGMVAKDSRGNMVDSGSWRVIDASKRKFEMKWRAGWTDTLTLSPDNNSLEGTNQANGHVSAKRIAQ